MSTAVKLTATPHQSPAPLLQPRHEWEEFEARLRMAPNAAKRFGFLESTHAQHALYCALRDGVPIPEKTKEQIQAERRQRAKLLAASLST